MSILYLLIPLTLLVMVIAVLAFLWAVKNHQFDDLEGPAYRILMDEDDPRIPGRKTHEQAQDRLNPPKSRKT